MKKILLFSFTVTLISLAGCSQPKNIVPLPCRSASPSPATTSNETIIEPLKPVVPKTEEPKKQETSMFVPAKVIGKVAVETIPLPPVEDLTAQIDEYVTKISRTIDDLDGTIDYKTDSDAVVRDTNGLSLVALAVGLSETDSKYKNAAPGIIKAAAALAAVENYDDAKKNSEALKAALKSSGDPATLSWTKVAELTPVMKAVPNLSSSVTRWTNTERKLTAKIKNPKQLYGALAALAVISQGSIANAKDTDKPDQEDQWKKDCEQFRDTALKANTAAHSFAEGKADYSTYWAAFKKMTDTCDTCHQTFHTAEVDKTNSLDH